MNPYPENQPPPSLWLRLWFVFSLGFGFLAGTIGALCSVFLVGPLVTGTESVSLYFFVVFLLAPVPFLLLLVLSGRARFAVPLEACGAGAVLLGAAGLAGLSNRISLVLVAILVLGGIALAGFHFCRKSVLPTLKIEKRTLMSACLTMPLMLSFLHMGLEMDSLSFVPDSILLFGYGTVAFALAVCVLLPLLFFSPGAARVFILGLLGLFLPFCAALAYETNSLITEYLNDPHTIECGCTGPGDIYVTGGWEEGLWGGLAALALLLVLLLLNRKAPRNTETPA